MLLSRSTVLRPNSRHSCVAAAQPSRPPTLKPLTIDDQPVELTGVPDAARLCGTISSRLFSCRRERKHGQTRRNGVGRSCVWRTTPVAKPDWIEEPSVTTATVTMSRSLRALGGSMAASRRDVVLVVVESVASMGLRCAPSWRAGRVSRAPAAPSQTELPTRRELLRTATRPCRPEPPACAHLHAASHPRLGSHRSS